MSGLMMASKDGNFVDRAGAFRTDIIPAKTRTYQPVTNQELVLMTHKISDEFGLSLKDECLGMAGKNKEQFFATYIVEGKDFFDNQIQMMLGVVNSYDKTLTAQILFGQKVNICSNMSFSVSSGENGIKTKFRRKHTSNIFSEEDGLYYKLSKCFEQIDNFVRGQERFCEQLREHKITEDEAYSIVVRSARENVIGKTNILDICDLWDRQASYPNSEKEYASDWHEDFRPRDTYSLFNCYTEKAKNRINRNPVAGNLDSLKLTNFFNKEFVMN